jgi:hypothetical protein
LWNRRHAKCCFSGPNNSMDGPEVPSETTATTLASDVKWAVWGFIVTLKARTEPLKWHLKDNRFRSNKWLLLNGCEYKALISTATEFLNTWQAVEYACLWNVSNMYQNFFHYHWIRTELMTFRKQSPFVFRWKYLQKFICYMVKDHSLSHISRTTILLLLNHSHVEIFSKTLCSHTFSNYILPLGSRTTLPS